MPRPRTPSNLENSARPHMGRAILLASKHKQGACHESILAHLWTMVFVCISLAEQNALDALHRSVG